MGSMEFRSLSIEIPSFHDLGYVENYSLSESINWNSILILDLGMLKIRNFLFDSTLSTNLLDIFQFLNVGSLQHGSS